MAIEAEAYETMEAFESESESEASEASEAARIRKPSSRPSFVPRSLGPTPPVTQGQLQAALSRVDGKIKTVADVESTINSKVGVLAAANKKEVADRKKSVETQFKDLNQKVQLLSLLPLLLQPPTDKVGGKDVLVPDPNKFNAILPLLLVSGLGGGASGSGGGLGLGGDGGSDGGLLVLALALAFSGK
jgi:hypothetical protein